MSDSSAFDIDRTIIQIVLLQLPSFPYSLTLDMIVSSLWLRQMETFFALLAICAGNSPVSGKG